MNVELYPCVGLCVDTKHFCKCKWSHRDLQNEAVGVPMCSITAYICSHRKDQIWSLKHWVKTKFLLISCYLRQDGLIYLGFSFFSLKQGEWKCLSEMSCEAHREVSVETLVSLQLPTDVRTPEALLP